MNTDNRATGPVDRTQATRMLAEAEGRSPVSTDRDRRVFAVFTAGIAVAMGVGLILMMLSPWAFVPYALAIAGLIWWQMSARQASPRGANLTYVLGIVGSGAMVGLVVGLNALAADDDLTIWWSLLGGLVVAAPGLVAAALIALRGGRQGDAPEDVPW